MYRPNPHPLGDSVTIRRAYPLVVKAMGFVDGRCWVARANWDRVEVRDEEGRVRFAHTIPRALSEGLLDGMAIVDGHLACAISSGIMPYGLRVWDLRSGEIVIDVVTGDVDGPYLLSSPPGSSTVVAAEPERVVLWDLVERRRVRAWPVADPLSATFDTSTGRLASGDWLRIDVHDGSGERLASWSVEGGDVEELAWAAAGRWLLGRTVNGRIQVWDPGDGAVVATLDARGDILAASPCGRWIALTDGVVALDDRSVQPVAVCAAAFDASTNTFAFADAERIWRVAV